MFSLDYQYTSQGFGNQPDYNALNRVTAIKQRILGESTWLLNVTFYDHKGRPIQTKSNNQRQSSLNDVSTSHYAFDGRITDTKRYVDAGLSGNISVTNRFEYDDAGRMTHAYQTNGADPEQHVAEYQYNELGQLIEKELHGDGTDFLQSVDYRYNIRGWLTQINGSDLEQDAINSDDDLDDIFGMDLLYTTTESGVGNTTFHNGNISAVKWNTDDPHNAGTKRKRSYAFSYDKSDRILGASYKAHNGSNWTTVEQGVYDVTGISYDRNGNIQGLSRYYQQDESSSRAQIDDLNYTYAANRLTKVDDAADDNLGFKESVNQTTEYTYDNNGNVLTDLNKGLTYSYNDLNKTEKVAFSSTKYIEYTHTASGGRIEKYVRDDATAIDETWYYINGFVFKDNNLDHFGMSEGVVRNVDGDLRYEYFLKDHQGNTRMTFTADGQDNYMATMESSQASAEEAFFYNVAETRHSDGQFIIQTGAPNSKLSYMDGLDPQNGGSGEIGLAKALKVGKGDIVSMSVWSKYTSATCGSNCSTVDGASVTTALASMFGGVANAGGEVQAIYDGIDAGITAIFAQGGHGSSSPGSKVYLNWLLFDENYTLENAGFQEASTSITQLNLTIPSIDQNGYVYIYLSNESGGTQKAFFDNFSVSHTKKINVLQENVYYPFGLTFEGVAVHVPTPSGNTANKYLYNRGSEQVELDIRNYDTPFRQYDATIGRFQGIDALADIYSNQSPYQFANNDPVFWSDPTGLGGECETCLFTDIKDDVKDPGQRGSSAGGWSSEVNNFISSYDANVALRLLTQSTHGGSWNRGSDGVEYRSSSSTYYLGSYSAGAGEWREYYSYDGETQTIEIDGKKVKVLQNVNKINIWVPNNNQVESGFGWDDAWNYLKTGATVVRAGASARKFLEVEYVAQATINNSISGVSASVPNALKTITTVSRVGGGLGILAAWGIAGYQVATGTDNTSTWVHAGLNTAILTAAILGGPITAGIAAGVGIVYGISYLMASDEIDSTINDNFGYR